MDKVRFKQAGQVTRAGRYGKAGAAATVLLAGFLGMAFASPPYAESPPYHVARTTAEKALVRILDAQGENYNLDVMLGRPPGRSGAPVHIFEPKGLFTPKLVKALRVGEKTALKVTCGGRYSEGDLCGFDFDPVACTQSGPEIPRYLTRASTADRVTVDIKYLDQPEHTDGYKLKRVGGLWLLDGVRCGDFGVSFNFK